LIKQGWKHLTIMDSCWRNGVSPDEVMLNIDTNTVLVAVVINAVLLDLPGINILLLQSIWQF